jgi:hypothetical protein
MIQLSGVRSQKGPAIVWRCRALIYLFALALVICSSRAQTNLPPELPDSIQLNGFLEHPAIIESSGLVASRQFPGGYWTHNDDGEQFLFAIDETGKDLGAFQVQGTTLIDWEAIATDDRGNLYLADIGADGIARTYSAIHRVEEPNPADRFGPARIQQSWFVRFPEVRLDCESFFVLNGYGYLVTKERVGGMVSIWRFFMGSATFSMLEFVGSVETSGNVTDASLSPDGRRLAFVTNEGVEVFFINGDPASISRDARADTELSLEDMEGVAFSPDGLLVTRDGARELLSFESDQLTGQPVFTRALSDQTVFVGENVIFSVVAEGFPQVTFAWYFNGELIPGQTNSTLVLANVTLANAGIYQVIASNANGSARSVARLVVRERLFDVRITEVMPSQRTGNTNLAKADWWELTSFNDQPINLAGWRFNDATGNFSDAAVIPDVTIQPGESIIFVEDLSPAEFQDWWGEQNFAPGTQIITYSGSELSFAAAGDTLRLWTPDVTNTVYMQVSFGAADPGVSFGFNPVTEQFGEQSVAGVNGAFLSVDAVDVASPGRIRNPPVTETADIRITEVMSSEAPGTLSKRDWFELTSFHPTAVDLSGWRFNDGTGGFPDAYVITNSVIILPGESIIFVEELSPQDFLAWWGPTNFAPGTQIVTYSGAQLSFSSLGDSLRVWDRTNALPVTEVTFGPAAAGVSFGYNPDTEQFGEPSVVGVHGAFVSADGLDVGSPGRIRGEISAPTVDVRITEVMSSEAPGAFIKEDWFELTNFEDEAINLSGWRFNDGTGGFADAYVITNTVIIQPGESVVFVEDLLPQDFVTWWGATNFAPGTQIVTYSGTQLSFSSAGDSLRVWDSTNSIPVVQVTFGAATVGVSFGYNPDTAQFGGPSQEGVFGAFRSADGLDVGSPGRIRNPVADTLDLRITEVMSSEATTTVPVEDWWELTSFDSEPIDISGWRFNDATGGLVDAFVIPVGTIIQPGQSVIFVENLTSNEFLAWWGLNVPDGTQIITYSGVQLSFAATGDSVRLWTDEATDDAAIFTQVTFGATDPGFSFGYDPDLNVFGERSQIGVHGAFQAISGPDVGSPGRIRGENQTTVDVRITEVMSSPAPETPSSADWWELTSFHDAPVNLGGWRFNDATGGFADAFILPENTIIQPGESIIFVEDLTSAEFVTWWGPENFANGTQIITYSGVQLSFSANGDSVRIWDNTATGDADVFTQVAFGTADPGISFGYDPDQQIFGEKSQPGVNGAFVAATGPDVGSPGRIRSAGQIRTQFSAGGMQIEILNPGDDSYAVEMTEDLVSNDWAPTGEVLQSTNGMSLLLNKPFSEPKAFYRVRKL